MLVGAALLYQGLVLRGLIAGAGAPLDAEAATLVLVAAGTMGLAAATMHRSAGIAAVEMTLAGAAAASVAGPHHRYLLAYGGVAIALAAVAAIVEVVPPRRAHRVPRHRAQRSPQVLRGALVDRWDASTAPYRPRTAVPYRTHRSLPTRPSARQAVRRVADARGRQEAARQAWRAWRANPAAAERRRVVMPGPVITAEAHPATGTHARQEAPG